MANNIYYHCTNKLCEQFYRQYTIQVNTYIVLPECSSCGFHMAVK